MIPAFDAHVHVWDLDRATYDWLGESDRLLNRTYTLSELTPSLAEAGVTHGLLVQAANHATDTQLMLDTMVRHPWIQGVVGWTPLTDPVQTSQLIADYVLTDVGQILCGIRHLIHIEPDPRWLLQTPVLESLSLLAEAELAYDVVGITTDHLEAALQVAERVPQLRLVLDHLNKPPVRNNERYGHWGELMRTAAQHPNVWVKLSGLGTTVSKPDWSAEDLKPYVAYVLEHFGTDRCLCGGDWPVSLLAGSYVQTWQTYRQLLADLLSTDQQRNVLFNNAFRAYRLAKAFPNQLRSS